MQKNRIYVISARLIFLHLCVNVSSSKFVFVQKEGGSELSLMTMKSKNVAYEWHFHALLDSLSAPKRLGRVCCSTAHCQNSLISQHYGFGLKIESCKYWLKIDQNLPKICLDLVKNRPKIDQKLTKIELKNWTKICRNYFKIVILLPNRKKWTKMDQKFQN